MSGFAERDRGYAVADAIGHAQGRGTVRGALLHARRDVAGIPVGALVTVLEVTNAGFNGMTVSVQDRTGGRFYGLPLGAFDGAR